MASTHKNILLRIKKLPPGELIFPTDFRGLGSEAAIKMAMSRLVKEKKFERIAHGIYLLPKTDPVLGKLRPSLESIAQAIAEREHVRIRPAGAYALNKLGLSTQIPMKLVYITDGAPRQIRIGKGGIKFKATTPKKLSLKGKISSLVIQALDELGPKAIDNEMKRKIQVLLKKENPKNLKADIKLAPAWINDFIYSLQTKQNNNGTMAAIK
jgi:hypothetical protein